MKNVTLAIDEGLLRQARDLAERRKTSLNALFGAPIFYTEDLNHGQVYGTVRAVDPFL